MKTFFLILFLSLAAWGGYVWLNTGASREVSVISPERGDIETVIRVTGKVVNDRTVKMAALIDGQITEMRVRKGEAVEAGAVLTVLDKREAEARLKKAEAELVREQQAVSAARRTLRRLQEVSRSGGASAQAVEDAEAALRAARARSKVAEAVLEIEKIHRVKVEVTAPFAGVITEKRAEVGQWLEAGTELFTLVAHEGREIEVNVDAGDSAEVHVGQLVSLSSDAWPGQSWEERIARISPAITVSQNQALNAFAVRITLGDSGPPLLLGQQVDARIHTDRRDNVLTLPFDALIEGEDEIQIAVLEAGRVALRKITTGLEDFTRVEVLGGLAEGDQVILPVGKALQEGEVVTVKP